MTISYVYFTVRVKIEHHGKDGLKHAVSNVPDAVKRSLEFGAIDNGSSDWSYQCGVTSVKRAKVPIRTDKVQQ